MYHSHWVHRNVPSVSPGSAKHTPAAYRPGPNRHHPISQPCCHPPARRGWLPAGAPARNGLLPPPHWPPQRAASRPTASCALSEGQEMEAGEATGERWKVSKIKCLTHLPSQAQKTATVCGAARTSTSQTKQRTCSRLFSPPGNSSYAALAPTRHSPAGEARQQEQQLLFLEILLHAKANNQAACVPWRVPATPLHVWHERQRVGALPIPSPALVPHTRSARTAIRPTPGAHLRGWSMRGSGAACCRFNPRRSRTKPSCPFVRLTRGVGPSRVQSQLVAVQPGDAAGRVGPKHIRKE